MTNPAPDSELGIIQAKRGGIQLNANTWVDRDGEVHGYALDGNNPTFSISPSIVAADAFGRLQVSNPHGVWSNKNIHSKHDALWEERVGGAGTISHNINKASVSLSVGTASGDYAIRQTGQYFNYVPGKGQVPKLTTTFAPAKTNLFQAVGYFDGPAGAATTYGNGLYLGLLHFDLFLCIRTDTGGAGYTESKINQADWNIDKLDGTGPSLINLDITKSQIIESPFQWLGVGAITWGLSINGEKIPVHREDHANETQGVYMRTPSLPIRYEIRNVGTTDSSSTLEEICNEVTSDGGYSLPGIEYSVETGKEDTNGPMANLRPVSVLGDAPLLLLRLKPMFNGMMNRQTIRYLNMVAHATGDTVRFTIAHIHDTTSIDADWLDPNPTMDIGVQYAYKNAAGTGNPSYTGGETHTFQPVPVEAGQAGKGGSAVISAEYINSHAIISNNFEATNPQLFAVLASAATAATAYCAMDFIISE